MSGRGKFANRAVALSFLLFLLLCLWGARNAASTDARHEKQNKDTVVYVCACLKTRSCSCMTIAKTGGVCACGPKGGPPLKAVPRDSDWAKENREALAN